MNLVLLLARRLLFKRKGGTFTASAAVGATIFLLVFNSLVFGGVLNGVVRDLGDYRFGKVQITNEKGDITTPDYQIVLTALKNPNVVGAAPHLTTIGDFNFTSVNTVYSKTRVETVGVDPNLEPRVSNIVHTIVKGTFLTSQNSIVLGATLAADLHAEIGKWVTVKVFGQNGPAVKRLQVIGVSDIPGFSGFNNAAMMHIKTLREMRGTANTVSSSIIVRVPNSAQWVSVKDWIQHQFPKLKVQTVLEAAEPFITGFSGGIAFINLVGYVGMIASALGIIVILTMIVTGKTREIGVLRAMGVSKFSIILIFVIAGAIIGAIGAAIGGIASVIATIYMQAYPIAPIGGIKPEVVFNPTGLVFPMFAGFALSVLASIYPARRASKSEPAEAMRYF